MGSLQRLMWCFISTLPFPRRRGQSGDEEERRWKGPGLTEEDIFMSVSSENSVKKQKKNKGREEENTRIKKIKRQKEKMQSI